jgi:hypothetical protein
LSSAASSRFKRCCLLPGGLEEVFILLSTTVAAGESMESAYSLLDQEGGRVVECYLQRALRKRPNFAEFPSGGDVAIYGRWSHSGLWYDGGPSFFFLQAIVPMWRIFPGLGKGSTASAAPSGLFQQHRHPSLEVSQLRWRRQGT